MQWPPSSVHPSHLCSIISLTLKPATNQLLFHLHCRFSLTRKIFFCSQIEVKNEQTKVKLKEPHVSRETHGKIIIFKGKSRLSYADVLHWPLLPLTVRAPVIAAPSTPLPYTLSTHFEKPAQCYSLPSVLPPVFYLIPFITPQRN